MGVVWCWFARILSAGSGGLICFLLLRSRALRRYNWAQSSTSSWIRLSPSTIGISYLQRIYIYHLCIHQYHKKKHTHLPRLSPSSLISSTSTPRSLFNLLTRYLHTAP